ncbi:MAG: ABC transporter substrate-binding protein [Kiritimatiellae bacterium]|nr:ABC transporter substrate-binding protein [Kiritimatiellia bacterium]
MRQRAGIVIRAIGVFVVSFFLGCSRTSSPDGDGVRIVSAAPGLTECLCAIGAEGELVGRTDVCDYPPSVKAVPVTGKFAQPFLEATLGVAPTHIVECSWLDESVREKFRELGVAVVTVPCAKMDEVPAALRQLGKLSRHEEAADRVATRLERGIAEARKRAQSNAEPPRVLVLVDSSAPITVGPDTFISEMVTLAGGTNIAERATADYYHLSMEWLLLHQPDVILCLFHQTGHSTDGYENYTALFSERPGWKTLRAVRNRRVFTVPDIDRAVRPGPRILDGIREIEAVLKRSVGATRQRGS